MPMPNIKKLLTFVGLIVKKNGIIQVSNSVNLQIKKCEPKLNHIKRFMLVLFFTEAVKVIRDLQIIEL